MDLNVELSLAMTGHSFNIFHFNLLIVIPESLKNYTDYSN